MHFDILKLLVTSKSIIRVSLFSIVSAIAIDNSPAQSLPVGTLSLEEIYRRAQLVNDSIDGTSFCLRPLYLGQSNITFADKSISLSKTLFQTKDSVVALKILSQHLYSKTNSTYPYPTNDGPMLPARGWQSIISPGIYGKFGMFSIQLRPEIYLSENLNYPGFADLNEEELAVWPHSRRWPTRYRWWNNIDTPEKFGQEQIQELLPGQSFVQIMWKGIALKASTENLWWGPGKFNSLIISNNARGFPHVSLNTIRPISTPVGNIEVQFLWGKLSNSGYYPPDTTKTTNNTKLYVPKLEDEREINGLGLSFEPKWVKGLFLGILTTSQQYAQTARHYNNHLPILANIFNPDKLPSDTSIIDNKTSIFGRWVMKNSEIYFEYGRNNSRWSWETLANNSPIDAAYVIGFSRLFPLSYEHWYIETNFEFSSLRQPPDYMIRVNKPDSWYVHEHVRHGYTQRGEIIGHRAGPGSQVHSTEIALIIGLNKISYTLERMSHNNDYYYLANYGSQGGNFWSYWVDIANKLEISLANNLIDGLIVNFQLQHIKSINYQWNVDINSRKFYGSGKKDNANLMLGLNLFYTF